MSNFSKIDKTRLSLIICLESMKIYKKNKILANITQEFKNSKTIVSYNKLRKTSQFSYAKSLSNMQNILHSTNKKDEKNKIIYILQSYSNTERYSNHKFNSIFSKYINKFAYKYVKYYKYNFINKDHKKNNNIDIISLIYLYLLYKTLKTSKKFYIYKHLDLRINELKY